MLLIKDNLYSLAVKSSSSSRTVALRVLWLSSLHYKF